MKMVKIDTQIRSIITSLADILTFLPFVTRVDKGGLFVNFLRGLLYLKRQFYIVPYMLIFSQLYYVLFIKGVTFLQT